LTIRPFIGQFNDNLNESRWLHYLQLYCQQTYPQNLWKTLRTSSLMSLLNSSSTLVQVNVGIRLEEWSYWSNW